MLKDYGAFLVTVSVLDKKTRAKFMVKEDIGLPVANGWQISGEDDLPKYLAIQDNWELVTIHTLNEIINIPDNIMDLKFGAKVEINYSEEIEFKII